MVRGTNKMIIEINDTGSPYFEKAVLYLKEGHLSSAKSMESEATKYISSIQTISKSDLLRRSLIVGACKLIGAAAVGALIMLLFLAF